MQNKLIYSKDFYLTLFHKNLKPQAKAAPTFPTETNLDQTRTFDGIKSVLLDHFTRISVQ